MYILKEVKGIYNDLWAIKNVTEYIIADKTRPGYILPWTYSFNIFNLTQAAEEFMAIKQYYNDFGGKLLRHFVISFDKKDYFTVADAMILAFKICGFFSSRFQVMYAVHQNTKHIHIHFVVNTTSFVDGKRLSDSYEDRAQFKKYVRKCYNRVRGQSGRIINSFKRQEREAWG